MDSQISDTYSFKIARPFFKFAMLPAELIDTRKYRFSCSFKTDPNSKHRRYGSSVLPRSLRMDAWTQSAAIYKNSAGNLPLIPMGSNPNKALSPLHRPDTFS